MNLRQFDLNLLVALHALLEERSVTKAGERLHLSQSAMSGMLSRLRLMFRDELLVKTGRHLEPTVLGVELAGPVREAVRQLEVLLDTKRLFVPGAERRVFLVAASDYVVFLLQAPLLKRLGEFAPHIHVRFVALEPTVEDRVNAGDIDFAILPIHLARDFPQVPLFEDSWVCAAWSGHPSIPESMTRQRFAEFSYVAYSPSYPDYAVNEAFTLFGYQREIVASTETFAMLPFMVQGTNLLTTLPKRLALRLREAADIQLIEPAFDVPPLQERLLWSPRFTGNPPHDWFREQLIEAAKTL